MSKVFGAIVTLLFVMLSAFSTYALWLQVEWRVALPVLVTLLIAAIGEHHVSGMGYYHYTSINGIFIGRVPVWVPFMWVFVCNSTILLCFLGGVHGILSMFGAGLIGVTADLVVIEPVFSRMKGIWQWTPVRKGYFAFIPEHLYRFTAPIGNYLVWFGFPLLMAWLLDGLIVYF